MFLIAEWTSTSEHEGLNERIDNFVLLLQVLNVSSAFEIHEDSVALLELIIARYFESFARLYPDYKIPKDHLWCTFQNTSDSLDLLDSNGVFDSKLHMLIPSLLPIVKNFENIASTFCHRYQA